MNRNRRIFISIVFGIVLVVLIILGSTGKSKNDGKEPEKGSQSVQKEDAIKNKNPVLYDLPYENSHFKIEYVLLNNKDIQYSITLYGILNRPEQYSSYVEQTKQYKQEALTFLSNSGVDTTKANIKFSPDNIQ
jgi:hypothetical protein